MNSLLKRQIRKFLPEDVSSSKDLELFLDAINRSYENFEDQSLMIQRAMEISSQELSEANSQLREETKSQLEVINKLKEVINTLKFYELSESNSLDALELEGSKLVDFINNQTKEIISMNQQRELLLNNLSMQNQELNDYAHMVSHDLKSPLRSIHTLTTWLIEDFKDNLNEEGNNTLQLIMDNVEKMESLITGILNYTKIGSVKSENIKIDTNNLVEEILHIIYIPEHISVEIEKPLPIVNGDRFKLQQLFQNILDNAVKYNDKPKGLIKIGCTELNGYFEFYIKDNGKGMNTLYYEKIFKTFQKLENDTNSSGIGLSIVKKIVEFYNGKVWVESIEGKGSTFYFTLKK